MNHRLPLLALALAPALAWAQPRTADECVEMALQHNADLKNARLELKASAEQKQWARTKYFPKVDAAATGFLSSHDLVRADMPLSLPIPELGALPIPIPISMVDKGALAMLTVLQPLYAGGQIVTGNKLAAIQHQANELKLEMTQNEVEQSVRNTYWQLMAVRAQQATLDAADKQLQEAAHHVDQYVSAGVATRNDQLRVELKKQEVRSLRLKLENGMEALRMLLAEYCGVPAEGFEAATEQIDNPRPPEAYRVDPSSAVAGRVETRLLGKAVDAKALLVKMERAKLMPTVAIGAAGLYYNMMEQNKGTVMGLATMAVPISEWWSGNHNVRRAKVALEQQQTTLRDVEQKLHIDVAVAWNALCEAYAQIDVARLSVTQADENLRLSTQQLQAGTITTMDFLDAFTLFTQSHSNLAAALATYQSCVADYQRKTR